MNALDTLLNWLTSGLVVLAIAYIIPGVNIDSFFIALAAALVLGLINAFIKPVIFILTLPINILTLGIFTLVINALMVMLTATIVPGFEVVGFWSSLLFAIILSLTNIVLRHISLKADIDRYH